VALLSAIAILVAGMLVALGMARHEEGAILVGFLIIPFALIYGLRGSYPD